jgi:hypothetical protein
MAPTPSKAYTRGRNCLAVCSTNGLGTLESTRATGTGGGPHGPLADLLIFACAKLNGLDIAHDDSHFEELADSKRDNASR